MECTLVLSVGGPTKHITRAIRVIPIKECTLVLSVGGPTKHFTRAIRVRPDQGMHSSAMECTLVLSVGGPTKHFTLAIRVRPTKECTLERSVCAIRVSPDQGMHSCAVCGRPDQAFHACSSCTDQRIAMRWVFFGFWPILWMGNKRFLYFMRTSKKSCAEY